MVLLCMIWGVQQVASKVAITEGMPPVMQATLRSAVAGALLLGWIGLRQGRAGLGLLVRRDRTWGPGLLTAVLFAGEFLLLFPGVERTTASRAVVLLFTGPFFTALGAHLFLPDERLRLVHVGGLILAFAGVVLTLSDNAGGGTRQGDALVLGAAVLWGLTAIVVKAAPELLRQPAERVLAYQLIGSLPLLVVAAVGMGELTWPTASPRAWASLAYQCCVVAFASYLAWYVLVARYPAGKLAAFTFLTPLFGVAAAALLLGEALSVGLGLGLVFVGIGLVLVNRP